VSAPLAWEFIFIAKMKVMTWVKDNPMDESEKPTPRPVKPPVTRDRKKKERKANLDDRSVDGRTDKDAFDARNNNMTKNG
jgi:hypothetical protein